MSSDNDGDNKDLKCGAPECNHQRFKSQQEREEHWESNILCVFYNIQEGLINATIPDGTIFYKVFDMFMYVNVKFCFKKFIFFQFYRGLLQKIQY